MSYRILIVVTLAASVLGCGRKPELSLGQFASYVHQYEAEAAAVGQPVKIEDLVVSFGTPDSAQEQGWCRLSSDQAPFIGINQAAWNLMTTEEQMLLFRHELGHCSALRKHLSGSRDNGTPLSIMNPYALSETTFLEARDYYLYELFTGR